MVEILPLLNEIPQLKDKEIDEQPDTTDKPELKSEEPAEHKGAGI